MGLADQIINNGRNLLGRPLEEDITKTIFIEVEDVLCEFGETLTYMDIINRKGGYGSMSKVYSTLVHPVIAGLFNESVTDVEKLKENLAAMVNFGNNDDVGNYVYDRVEELITQHLYVSNDRMTVSSKALHRFACCMIMMLAPHIRNISLDVLDDIRYRNSLRVEDGFLVLRPEVTSQLVPSGCPDQLVITLNFTWVCM